MKKDNVVNFPEKPRSTKDFVNLNELTCFQLEEVRFHFNGNYWVHESKVKFEQTFSKFVFWVGAILGIASLGIVKLVGWLW